MILCAGQGTRFRPHTEKLAKPSLPFLNTPLMGFPLFYLESLGLKHLVINTHHLPDTVMDTASDITQDQDYTVTFLNEAPEILGSGGGIAHAREHFVDEPYFIVINGDEVIVHPDPNFLQDMIDTHIKSKALATFLTMDHPEAGQKYPALRIGPNDKITEISVKNQTDPSLVHNCGVYVYSPRVFDFLPSPGRPSHIFKDALIPAMRKGETLLSYRAPKDMLWWDTSSEEDYLESTRQAVGLLTNPLGPTAETLQSILSRYGHTPKVETSPNDYTLVRFEGAEIHESTRIKGFVVLGSGSLVDQGVIENSVIGPGIHVHEMASLKNQLVI